MQEVEEQKADERAQKIIELLQSGKNSIKIKWQCMDRGSLFYKNLQSRCGLKILHIAHDSYIRCNKCQSYSCLNHWLEIQCKPKFIGNIPN